MNDSKGLLELMLNQSDESFFKFLFEFEIHIGVPLYIKWL